VLVIFSAAESVCMCLVLISLGRVIFFYAEGDLKVIRNLTGRRMAKEACENNVESIKISEINISK
jgi:hypothetical protein